MKLSHIESYENGVLTVMDTDDNPWQCTEFDALIREMKDCGFDYTHQAGESDVLYLKNSPSEIIDELNEYFDTYNEFDKWFAIPLRAELETMETCFQAMEESEDQEAIAETIIMLEEVFARMIRPYELKLGKLNVKELPGVTKAVKQAHSNL